MRLKYEFTDETKTIGGHTLRRIRRLSDDRLGGWIEKEDNLSQEGNCWVDNNACVFDDAVIKSNAQIYGDAKIFGNAKVYDEAKIYGNAHICASAQVYDNAVIYGNAHIYGKVKVYGNATVYDNAEVRGSAKIYDNAKVYDNAVVFSDAQIYSNAKIHGNILIGHDVCNKNIGVTTENVVSSSIVKDFIYKVDDSGKLAVQTEYESIDEFFSEPIAKDIELNTIIICAVDTKEPIIKLEKVSNEEKLEFKFIVDITNTQGEEFMFKSIIKTSEQLDQLVQQTVDVLKNYPQFIKYIDDLKNCL